MATYYVSQSRDDKYDNPERRFKYRHRSSAGRPVAQELFDRLKGGGEIRATCQMGEGRVD